MSPSLVRVFASMTEAQAKVVYDIISGAYEDMVVEMDPEVPDKRLFARIDALAPLVDELDAALEAATARETLRKSRPVMVAASRTRAKPPRRR